MLKSGDLWEFLSHMPKDCEIKINGKEVWKVDIKGMDVIPYGRVNPSSIKILLNNIDYKKEKES